MAKMAAEADLVLGRHELTGKKQHHVLMQQPGQAWDVIAGERRQINTCDLGA